MQIAGADPGMMADAARYNVERGAQIIDINMGCPAKKVCNVAAGSALLQDEPLVGAHRRGGGRRGRRAGHAQDPHRLGPAATATRSRIARIAEDAGIQRARDARPHARLRLHAARPSTTPSRAVKAVGAHPGDRQRRHRHAGEGASTCSRYTGADAIMIGRAAQGRPWIFREIAHFLETGDAPAAAHGGGDPRACSSATCTTYYAFYGEDTGVRIARKHIGWYTKGLAGSAAFRQRA